MQSKEYKTIQIKQEDYKLLKEYCGSEGYKMGMFVGKLIRASCVSVSKKLGGNVLRVTETGPLKNHHRPS